MSDIVAFLTARFNEAAARCWAIHDVGKCDALLYEQDMADAAARDPDCDCGYPAYVLADIAAKRRIIDAYEVARRARRRLADQRARSLDPDKPSPTPEEYRVMDMGDAYGMALATLAAVYAGHPDYDEAWRP